MTLPDERYRAIIQARQLMHDLCDRTKTPRVPLAVRNRALGVLRHYPNQWDLDRMSANSPDVIVESMEALHRMVAAYKSDVDKQRE